MKELIEKWKAELERHKQKILEYSKNCEWDECSKYSKYFAQLSICICDAEMKLKQDTTPINFARWIAKNMWSIKETNFFIQDETKPKNHGVFTPRYYRYLDNEEQVKTLEELYNIFICE